MWFLKIVGSQEVKKLKDKGRWDLGCSNVVVEEGMLLILARDFCGTRVQGRGLVAGVEV